ncbi:MAG: efflux transporter outer membrane subunit [Alphaproteobacteria bacterium]|nr:efflux transporter outer membrane subunit [Alphaproteobacteria bacterium]
MKIRSLVLLCAVLSSACAVGPDYEPVKIDTALADTQWHGVLPHDGNEANLEKWWTQFDDPAMVKLIERAESDSPTLDAALARIGQARASVAKNIGGAFPTLKGSASVTRSKTGGGAMEVYQTVRGAGLDAGWEIDLFGGKRRAIEQSEALLESSQAAWHDARVSLAAEVADTYIQYRSCQSTTKLYERRLMSQRDTLGLVTFKEKAGLASGADLDLSEASETNVAGSLENQRGVCAQRFNALEQLTGLSAAELSSILAGTNVVPEPRAAKIVSLPAQTIEQRPDVAIAERNLAAATAAVGVAEAARFPSLSLAGAINLNKASGTSSVTTWSFGPTLSLPLFNAGTLEAEEDRAREAVNEALATYRETVRGAVKEVEDALARLDAVSKRLVQAKVSVDKYRSYLAATEANYRAGSVSLLDLEESQRQVYSAEETYVAAQQEQAQAWIALYKAVGGGWNRKFETK